MQISAAEQMGRPPSLLEILESAGRIYRGRMREFYVVAAVTLMAAWTINQIIKVWTIGGMPLGALEDPRAPEFFRKVGQVFGAGMANGMVYALLNSIASAILTICVATEAGQRRPSLPDAIRRAAARIGPLVGAACLFFIAAAGMVGLLGVALGLPAALGLVAGATEHRLVSVAAGALAALLGIAILISFALSIFYLSLRWALYPQAAVLERTGPLDALRRSASLTRTEEGTRIVDRYIVRAAVLLLILVLIQMAVGTVGALPALGAGLLFRESGDLSEVSVLNPTGMPLSLVIPLEIFSVLLSAAVMPYGITVFILLYLDQREREGTAFARRSSRNILE